MGKLAKIALLFTPLILFMLVMTGNINVYTLKRNFQALPGKAAVFVREVADKTSDELSRRFPNLLK